MYIPGRLRTASSPSRTVMFSLPYDEGSGTDWVSDGFVILSLPLVA